MTTLQQIELSCPVCNTHFRSQAVVSTNSSGGKRTDFHERAAGTQPLPYLVGELWRRVGDERRAGEWFECVPGEVVDLSSQQWVIDAARQQRDCPREWFG